MAAGAVDQTRPNVWWVNQRRTFRHSAQSGFFWAPLRDRRGNTPSHWKRMEQVLAGDIVLHYNDGYVRAVSHVQAAAVHAPYPYDTDPEYGGMQGYLVRSQYHLLEPPIPRDILAGLKTLPEQDHPFTSTGSVKQGYLYRFGLDALSELVNANLKGDR